MSTVTHSLTLPASYDVLDQLKPFVEKTAIPAPTLEVARLVLAIHELCANIIRHAYDGQNGTISLVAERTPDRVQYRVRDYAPRGYTPPPRPSMPDPLTLPESGWGIFILHEVMTVVEYRRLPDGNEWLLIRELPA